MVCEWKFSCLGNCYLRAGQRCGHTRWRVKVYIEASIVEQIGADSIVCGKLNERPRAARPWFMFAIELVCVLVVVGVVESAAIRQCRLRTENRVVEHTLHAIAVAAVLRDA